MKNYWLEQVKATEKHNNIYNPIQHWDWKYIHTYDTIKESVQYNFNINILEMIEFFKVSQMYAGWQIFRLWELTDFWNSKSGMRHYFKMPIYEFNDDNMLVMVAINLPPAYPSCYASIEIKNLNF